jgi:hypothetical protein
VGRQPTAELRRGDQLPLLVHPLQAQPTAVVLELLPQRAQCCLYLRTRHLGQLRQLGRGQRPLRNE